MSNGYLTFLDYLELRRRVERRLVSGIPFLLHIIIFAIGAGFMGNNEWSPYYDPLRNYFINPSVGQGISLWAGILLAHGLWSYWHSGARGGRRDEAIENEMRQRLQANDTYLSDHPKDLFRLHGLLNEDIQKRANLIPTVLLFVIINAVIWIPWAILDKAFTSFAWTTSPLLIIPFILALVWTFWRRTRHERRLRQQLEQLFANDTSNDETNERAMRLGDDGDGDGELVTVEEYMLKPKRKQA